MRNFIALMFLLSVGLVQGQDLVKTDFQKVDNLVKAVYYYPEGSIHKLGYFKNKKPAGTWTEFDKKGNKIAIGFYVDGKKTGKWLQWNNNTLREITYENNRVVNVNLWKEDSSLALNNK